MSKAELRWALLACIGASASCASYSPKPLAPGVTSAAFDARSLRAPELGEWLRAELGDAAPFPRAEWDLASLTPAAWHWSAELNLARAHAATAWAGTTTAAARPNPVLMLSSEYATHAGATPWLLGFGLDFTLETAGKRTARIDAARAAALAAEIGVFDAAWSARSRLRTALLDVVASEREVELARAAREIQADRAVLVARRFAAGDAQRAEVTAVEVSSFEAELALHRAESGVIDAHSRLSAAIGIPARSIERERFVWPDMEAFTEEPDASSMRRDGLVHRLDVRRALLEYAGAEDDLRLEIAKQYPDVHLVPGFSWDQGQGKYALGFSFPLPFFDRNEGPIAEALARRAEAQVRFEGVQARALGDIDASLVAYHSRVAAVRETDRLLALVRARAARLQAVFDAGETDRQALLDARLEIQIAERAHFEAVREAQRARGTLEDALQLPLDAPSANSRDKGEKP